MSAYADLIERLRDTRPMPWDDDIADDAAKAADAITQLERENAELREAASVVIAANDQMMKAGVFNTDYANALDRLAALSRTQEQRQ